MSAASNPMATAAADANNIISIRFDKDTDEFRSACDGTEIAKCSEDTLRFLKKCRNMIRGDENVIHVSVGTEEWIAFQELCHMMASNYEGKVKTFVYERANLVPKFTELFKELEILDAKADKIMPILAHPHNEFMQLTLLDEGNKKCMSIRPTLKSNFYRFKSIPKPKKKVAADDNNEGSSSKKRKQDNTESEADQKQEEVQIIKITNCVILNKDGEIIPKNAISFSLVDGSDEVFNANICRALNNIACKYVDMNAHNEQSIQSIIRFVRMNKVFMEPDNTILNTLMKYTGTPKLLWSELISTASTADHVRTESEHIVQRLRIKNCVHTESGITRMIIINAD